MTERTTFKHLMALLFGFALRYKGLVGVVIAVGVLQALVIKAPYLLLKIVADALPGLTQTAEKSAPGIATHGVDWLSRQIDGLRDSVLGLLGLSTESGNLIIAASVLCVVLAFVGAGLLFAHRYLSSLAATRVVVDLRNRLCAHLMGLSLRHFGGQKTGELISRVTNDTNTVMGSFNIVFENAIQEPCFLLANVAIAYWASPMLGGIVFLTIVVLFFPMLGFGKRVRKGSGKSLESLGESTDAMAQMFTGFRTVKAFQLEHREVNEFASLNERFLRRKMRMLKAKASSQAVLYLIYTVGFALLLFCLPMALEGMSDNERLIAALPAFATTYTHVKRLARSYNLLKESEGALGRIQELFDLRSEIDQNGDGEKVKDLEGRIEFQDVGFSYGRETVFDGLSLSVEAGERVAFVGSSGAGKSTVLNLVARFYDPDRGSIVVDGKRLDSLDLESYLENLAIVDQSPFVFNTTIRENILSGRPLATEKEVLEAAHVALVDEFADKLELGYETVVGERGAQLSGGQLQRITIARAVLRNPRILLLDEATSALDTESEKIVQEALERLKKGRTVLMIAHRMSTVRNADRIFVLDSGEILEQGSHEELMRSDLGAYRHLWELQAEA